MEWTRFTAALVAALVVVAGVPVGAAALLDGPGVQAQTAGNSTVNVTTGQQLSTVLSATSDDVQSEVDETEFEVEYENRTGERRAEVVAERGTRLAERAEAIRDDYENATEAYEAGDLTRSEYAQRIATLNARAENLAESHDRLEDRLDARTPRGRIQPDRPAGRRRGPRQRPRGRRGGAPPAVHRDERGRDRTRDRRRARDRGRG
jgi:hypothetical protein